MACLAAVAALTGGCGGEISVDSTGGVSVNDKTLDIAEIPFTLRYPVAFREATDASLKEINALAVVGPSPDSYVAVRRNGTEAMSLSALEAQARRALGNSIAGVARGRHSGIGMIAITMRAAGDGRWAKIYGFSLAGATWLVDCRSTRADLSAMRSGCARALDSIEPRGS